MVLGGHNGLGWFRLVVIGSQGLRMVQVGSEWSTGSQDD
jgi:hypothetical protein